ncbi:MAG: hypothetical protein JW940_29020 [Polyangiaceae bacterium]|nr:hypothetical protein [Polyangiaceae bacterium]
MPSAAAGRGYDYLSITDRFAPCDPNHSFPEPTGAGGEATHVARGLCVIVGIRAASA